MQVYQIESTNKSPKIIFDKNNGELTISGRSVVSVDSDFYDQLLSEIDEYCDKPAEETKIVFHLEYFGDKSSRIFLEIFKKFEAIHRKKSKVSITWFYAIENTEMRDIGQDFEHLLNIPFKLIPVKDEIL